MPQFAVSYRRQVHQMAIVSVYAETKELATQTANTQITEQDWSTAFINAQLADIKEIREIHHHGSEPPVTHPDAQPTINGQI